MPGEVILLGSLNFYIAVSFFVPTVEKTRKEYFMRNCSMKLEQKFIRNKNNFLIFFFTLEQLFNDKSIPGTKEQKRIELIQSVIFERILLELSFVLFVEACDFLLLKSL